MNLNHVLGISDALVTNNHLKILDLSFSGIETNGCSFLAKSLKVNKTVQILNLSHNNIDSDGANCLGDMLANNTGLRILNLHHNKIESPGGIALAQGLCAKSTFLIFWTEKDEKQEDDVSVSFSRILKTNVTLRILNLANNSWNFESVKLMVQTVHQNNVLRVLNLKSNLGIDYRGLSRKTNRSDLQIILK
ncbi:hypothetical protein HK096_001178 [Nowakowskiella sp. JEL0078]|nr:hypothetical protein HK096_001178 [Nowakowskiella sp. JEL0078]